MRYTSANLMTLLRLATTFIMGMVKKCFTFGEETIKIEIGCIRNRKRDNNYGKYRLDARD